MLGFILEMTLITVDSHGWYCDRLSISSTFSQSFKKAENFLTLRQDIELGLFVSGSHCVKVKEPGLG